MDRFWEAVEKVAAALKVAGAACLVGMMLLTCADVVGRLFRHPIFGTVELVVFMGTLAVAMAMPYTHQIKGHIGVEILVRTFSRRTQILVDLVTGLLSLGLFGLITWRMTAYAGVIWRSGEVSMNLEFPEYLIIYAVAFCFLIFALVILQDLLRDIKKLRNQ